MSPMSVNTFDAQTVRLLAGPQPGSLPHGERSERWFAQLAVIAITVTVLAAVLT